MKFELWTWYHFLYILSPFIAVTGLYFIFRRKPEKTKWSVALVLAIINVVNQLVRIVYLIVSTGKMHPEMIPLSACHFANFIFLIAVLTKKQAWYNLAWCVNLPFGYMAIIFASPLAAYSTILGVLPMCYILGHFFLTVSILYVFVIGITKFDKKSFARAMVYAFTWIVVCIGANLVYNAISNGEYGTANYMYFTKAESGTPLTILFDLGKNYAIGNITINPVYIISVIIVGLAIFFIFYMLHQGLKKTGNKKLRNSRTN